jgi:hypothetical protein
MVDIYFRYSVLWLVCLGDVICRQARSSSEPVMQSLQMRIIATHLQSQTVLWFACTIPTSVSVAAIYNRISFYGSRVQSQHRFMKRGNTSLHKLDTHSESFDWHIHGTLKK